MKKIEIVMESPYATTTDWIKVPDDMPKEEIDEIARDMFFNHYNYDWAVVEEESE